MALNSLPSDNNKHITFRIVGVSFSLSTFFLPCRDIVSVYFRSCSIYLFSQSEISWPKFWENIDRKGRANDIFENAWFSPLLPSLFEILVGWELRSGWLSVWRQEGSKASWRCGPPNACLPAYTFSLADALPRRASSARTLPFVLIKSKSNYYSDFMLIKPF